ncbi:MFS transporter [Latilactobacillus curvatus]|uniref:MFS transporter n=1 Tax=Latilactobacillus curvatus TaxID=28038 RepID=UPI000FF8C60A|nr:hypothetical protein [Latilactobacillus curvatus]QAS50428.1 hypothetical protein LCU_08710 [Latilactobacillus curvatus JCM 1096 = DSM 20019]
MVNTILKEADLFCPNSVRINFTIYRISTYLLYFYTDVFGLSIGVAGTILLLTRCIDMFDAPIWGFLIDHTHTRWGQSRPYFLWLCLPFAVFTWLTFTTPNLSGTTKVVYAAVTYVIAGILYTGISTPMTSILPNLTNDPEQRTVLNWLLCQESGHKSTNKFDFQFKLLNLIFGGRSFSPVQILKTL